MNHHKNLHKCGVNLADWQVQGQWTVFTVVGGQGNKPGVDAFQPKRSWSEADQTICDTVMPLSTN